MGISLVDKKSKSLSRKFPFRSRLLCRKSSGSDDEIQKCYSSQVQEDCGRQWKGMEIVVSEMTKRLFVWACYVSHTMPAFGEQRFGVRREQRLVLCMSRKEGKNVDTSTRGLCSGNMRCDWIARRRNSE